MEEDHDSIFMRNIQRGVDKGIIKVESDGSKITYYCRRQYSTSFKNPEEKVRASYFCELVLDYDYPTENIDIEVAVPRRTPEDRADIVVYDEDGTEYLVIECKKDGITDAEFKQAIEQAFGNANSLRAKFASVIAGTTKTAFDVSGFKPNEREKNVISDIPKKYGKTPKYKFIKGEADKELKEVSREELIKALEKSHDTVWQGGKLAPTTAFDEVSKLLFCKLRDEKTTKKGETYSFQIGTHESAEEIFRRINAIYLKAKKEDVEVFKDYIRLEPKVVYNVATPKYYFNFHKLYMNINPLTEKEMNAVWAEFFKKFPNGLENDGNKATLERIRFLRKYKFKFPAFETVQKSLERLSSIGILIEQSKKISGKRKGEFYYTLNPSFYQKFKDKFGEIQNL